MTGDKWIRRLTAAVVLAVAGFAAVVSYSHIYDLGREHGQAGTAARLLPLSVDGLILAASLVLLHEARNGRSAPALARWMLGLGVSATVTANVAYGLGFGALGAVISAWPAVAFIGSAEMAIGMVRRSRSKAVRVADDKAARDAPASRQKTAPKSTTKTAPRQRQTRAAGPDIEASALAILARQPDVSGADLGRAIGASPRTGQRLLARLEDRVTTPQ
jgi:hypothetical protein